MAYQSADVVDAIGRASGTPLREMRVDGGASVMNLLMQMQADLVGVTVRRSVVQETTALGAAFLAGLGERVWDSPATVNATWRADESFEPSINASERDRRLVAWRRAVERSRGWAREP